MKLATCLAMALALCCSAAFAEYPATPSNWVDLTEIQAMKTVTGVPDPQPQVGGEDIPTAVPIPVLPYSDGGNTCAFLHDYDETCPYTGSTAPDVVYSYSPAADTDISIDLCNSGYDTKVFVYENSSATLVACNDDACGSDGFRSELTNVPLTAGNTYYIVVDGYFGACGTYDMLIEEPIPLECPPGALLEGEPDCGTNYVDNYNGGCNSTPNVFSFIPCNPSGNVTLCGKYGGFLYNGLSYRDTDWYELDDEGELGGLTYCITGEGGTLMGYINANLGCGAPFFEASQVLNAMQQGCLDLPQGNWWLWAGTSGFGTSTVPCGSLYVIELSNYACGPVAVEQTSWGALKGKYAE